MVSESKPFECRCALKDLDKKFIHGIIKNKNATVIKFGNTLNDMPSCLGKVTKLTGDY